MQSQMRHQSREWPKTLTAVPESEWPHREPPNRPLHVWRSREFLVQAYAAPDLGGREVFRLSVNRVTMGEDERWSAGITWDELQRVKRECGFGDWYGVEVFPRDRDIVNVANMRHIWVMLEPLGIGWFA